MIGRLVLRLVTASVEFFRRMQGSILISPIILVVLLSVALAFLGQVREILIRTVEPQNLHCGLHLVLGFAAVATFSVALFFSYLSACVVLRKTGIGYGSSLVYNSAREWKLDRTAVWTRNVLALICAGLPALALGSAFQRAANQVENQSKLLGLESSEAGIPVLQFCASETGQLAALLMQIANWWSALVVVLLLLLAIFSVIEFGPRGRMELRSTRTRRHWTLNVLAVVVLLLPIALLNIDERLHEALFRTLGPLTTLGLVLLSTTILLFAIAERSKLWGVPLFLIIGIVVFGVGLATWASTPPTPVELQASRAPLATDDRSSRSLHGAFVEWLKSRQRAISSRQQDAVQRPYPVYIIAAPGGGIYAASYVASVVSRLERRCPGFSQHVFAMSAVSGGAIGSAIVNTIARGARDVDWAVCSNPPRQQSASHVGFIKSVLSDDHLSPTLAATTPDVIVKLLQIGLYEATTYVNEFAKTRFDPSVRPIAGRAEALETSFAEAFRRGCEAAGNNSPPICSGITESSPLSGAFSDHWRKPYAAPALVLNATWAETGERIAFAPFSLAGIGDATLKAMSDLQTDNDRCSSLICAAIVSARFPAVLPAKIHRTHSRRWWNFVDGGYADASGTTTALEIYKELEAARPELEDKANLRFDLKLLILSEKASDTVNPSGAGLVHAISPITTLLTIREQIGRRAVARAIKELKDPATTPRDADLQSCYKDGNNWRVRQLLLDTKSLKLPLGWMLSAHTTQVIDEFVNQSHVRRSSKNDRFNSFVAQNAETFEAIQKSLRQTCDRW